MFVYGRALITNYMYPFFFFFSIPDGSLLSIYNTSQKMDGARLHLAFERSFHSNR